MQVVKRNGKREDYNCKKIKKAINFACEGLGVNPLELEAKFDEFLYDGVTTKAIQDNLILHAKNLASPLNDEWLLVAGRLATMDRWGIVGCYDKPFSDYFKEQRSNGEWSHDNFDIYTEDEISLIGSYIVKERDLQHTIASVETADSKYLAKNECIQMLFIGNAMLYASVEKTPQARLLRVKEFYEELSTLGWSLASPQLMNLRKGLNNASCFILSPDDDLNSIFDAVKDAAQISKNGGGLGWALGFIRAKGSSLMGTEGGSGGVLPQVKVLNDTLVYINQAGKRKGAGTVALPIWHNDIMDFFDIQTEVGDPRSKSFDIQPQVCFTDLFMQKLEDNPQQEWITVCPYEVKEKLHIILPNMYNEDFVEAYGKIEKAVEYGILKVFTKYKVIDLWRKYLQVFFEKGRPYATFVCKINRDNPNKHDGFIYCGNLCVAPETEILTRNGYQVIAELEGKEVEVWNGEEWSKTTVVKTGENQKLVTVKTSSNQELTCTEYHKWYIQDGYSGDKIVEKRTHELKVGDKLIKFDLPVIEGSLELDNAYSNGFYSGDGCFSGGIQRTSLYHGKQELLDKMEAVRGVYVDKNQNRTIVTHDGSLKDKFFVPLGDYTIESKIKWLAGLLDSDGTVARNGTNESLQITSIHLEFLRQIQLMLQTLGVSSKINNHSEAGYKQLPMNNGSGENGDFYCQESWRLLVSSSGLFKLAELGLVTYRLKWVKRLPQRNAEQFVTVKEIVDNGRYDDTLCFTEPKRHMGMFNGILTGQCQESFSNTKPDVYHHTCSLASLVVGRIAVNELSNKASSLTRLLNNGMMITKAPVVESENHLRDYRTIGVGIQGLADILAREWKTYEDLDFITEVCERIQYGCVRESIQMAKEYSPYPKFKGSRWDVGDIFDEYHKNSVCHDLDWLELKQSCKQHGIYNSQLTSPAPNTSTSLFMMASAGFMPHYAEYFYEDNKDGKTPVSSMYGKDNPIFYANSIGYFKQYELTKAVGAGQKFVDTGISAEYVLDRNIHEVTAKDVSMLVKEAWKNGNKTVYYLRTIKVGEQLVKTDELCSSCSG